MFVHNSQTSRTTVTATQASPSTPVSSGNRRTLTPVSSSPSLSSNAATHRNGQRPKSDRPTGPCATSSTESATTVASPHGRSTMTKYSNAASQPSQTAARSTTINKHGPSPVSIHSRQKSTWSKIKFAVCSTYRCVIGLLLWGLRDCYTLLIVDAGLRVHRHLLMMICPMKQSDDVFVLMRLK